VSKSIDFLDDTHIELSKTTDLEKPTIFASIQGGYDAKYRRISAEQIVKRYFKINILNGYFSFKNSLLIIATSSFTKIK